MAYEFGVKEVANVKVLQNGKPKLFLKHLKMSNLENNAETSYATGGQGNQRLITWDFGRTAVFNMQNALLNPKQLGIQAGADMDTGTVTIRAFREELTAVASATTGQSMVTLSHPAKDDTILAVYKADDDMGTEVPTVSVSGNTVEFLDTDVAVGETVVVWYDYDATGSNNIKLTIRADKFPGFYEIVGDTVVRNPDTDLDEPFQIRIPRAKIMPQWTMNLQPDGDPATFDFNVEAYPRIGESTVMVELIKYA